MSTLEDFAAGASVEFPEDHRTRIGEDRESSGRLMKLVDSHNSSFDEWWEDFSSDVSPEQMKMVARYAMARLMLAELHGGEVAELQERIQDSYDHGLLVERAAERIFEAAGMKYDRDEINRKLFRTLREILGKAEDERLKVILGEP